MVGSLVATRLGLDADRVRVGETLWFDNRDWTIVGRFSAPNTVMDAEIWMPLLDLQVATKREASVSCVVVSLGSAGFADIDIFAKSRLDLELVAVRESGYYSSIAAFYRPIRVMIMITAMLIAAGGVLGGLNTMYASFGGAGARGRDAAEPRVHAAAIVLNLSEESLFASACGALIGAVAGLLVLDGLAVRFSMGAFRR